MSAGAKQHIGQGMSAVERVEVNDASMESSMMSTDWMKGADWCRGIHGAARARRGTKRGTSAARRRHEKKIIAEMVEEMNE